MSEISHSEHASVGIDGEASVIRQLGAMGPDAFDALARQDTWMFRTAGCGFVYDKQHGTLLLLSSFVHGPPLFYYNHDGMLLFSSLQRPIRQLIQAQPDLAGAAQLISVGYNINGRTCHEGVRKLLPGQAIRFDLNDCAHFRESANYVKPLSAATKEVTDEQFIDDLHHAVSGQRRDDEKRGLMFSAGWDSRTILASMKGNEDSYLSLYSHGDSQSRELRLTRKLANLAELPLHLQEISHQHFDLDEIRKHFPQCEQAAFYPWTAAATYLRENGCTSVMSGIYGEIIGGHLGPVWYESGLSKYNAIMRSAMRLRKPSNVHKKLLWRAKTLPRWLNESYRESYETAVDDINDDIESTIKRYFDIGLESSDLQLEQFLIDHKGQWFTAQALSQRHLINVELPFADLELTKHCLSVPIDQRVQNQVNRRLLKQIAPKLLNLPTSAILVPVRYPMVIQETSRAVEYLYENHRWKKYIRSNGTKPQARLGWDNFEFLRSSDFMHDLIDSLQSPMIDREKLRKVSVDDLKSFKTSRKARGVAWELLRILSFDLLATS